MYTLSTSGRSSLSTWGKALSRVLEVCKSHTSTYLDIHITIVHDLRCNFVFKAFVGQDMTPF